MWVIENLKKYYLLNILFKYNERYTIKIKEITVDILKDLKIINTFTIVNHLQLTMMEYIYVFLNVIL